MLNLETGLRALSPKKENLRRMGVGENDASLWRRWRSGARTVKGARQQKERSLNELLIEQIPSIPWSVEGGNLVVAIKDYIRKQDLGEACLQSFRHNFEFPMNCMLESLRTNSVPDCRRLEMLLVLFYYILALKLRRNKTDELHKKLCTNYDAAWQDLCTELQERLSRIEEEWAAGFSDNLHELEFTAQWNATPGRERSGEVMRRYIEESDIRSTLRRCNERAPRKLETPIAELCVASRLEERADYAEILIRVQRADPDFKSKEYVLNFCEKGAPDLADFKGWVAKGGGDRYLERTSGNVIPIARAAVASILLLLAITVVDRAAPFDAESATRIVDIRPNVIESADSALMVTDIRPNVIENNTDQSRQPEVWT